MEIFTGNERDAPLSSISDSTCSAISKKLTPGFINFAPVSLASAAIFPARRYFS